MKGSISASVVAPPMPGSSPTQKPMPMPSSMKANGFHCSTRSKPWTNASPMRMSCYSPNFMYLLNSSTMSFGCDSTSFRILTASSPEV